MKSVKIKILILGGIKYDINIQEVIKWDSKFFEIDENIETIRDLPNSLKEEGEQFIYSDIQLKSIIGKRSHSGLIVAIINQKLEKNYYETSIGNNCYILSLYETAEIILKNDFKIIFFIIQELYYFAAAYYYYKGKIPDSDDKLTHHDFRKCLFDFNDNKNDISLSLGKVSICSNCESKFDKTFVPNDFVENIKKELKRIKKGKFYRIREFIKERPILSLIIGLIIAVLINMLSSFLYIHFFSP